MKKYRKTIFSGNKKVTALLALALLTLSMGAFLAAAAPGDPSGGPNDAANAINCVICKVASLIFMIVAALAALVIILAGLKWLTSGDDPGARSAAKTAIISAFVGIIIIFIAVYVVSWVITGLPGMKALNVDPTKWLAVGGCDSICRSIGTGTTTTGAGGGAKTCASICGSQPNAACYESVTKCHDDHDLENAVVYGVDMTTCSGTTPVCCCWD